MMRKLSSNPVLTASLACGLMCSLMANPISAQSDPEIAEIQPSAVNSGDPARATRNTILDIGSGMLTALGDNIFPIRFISGAEGDSSPMSSFCLWSGPAFERLQAPEISHADLEALLVPDYLVALPEFDAWGNAFEFRVDAASSSHFAAILSPGSDGTFDSSTSYDGGYTTALEDDLVFADGVFVRQPAIPPELYRSQAREDLRSVGTALTSWLIDQVLRPPTPHGEAASEPSSGATTVTLDLSHLTPYETVLGYLIPNENFYYTRCIPETDPWGRDYEYFINPNLLALQVLAIRTAGADGVTEGETYVVGPVYDPDGDLVWLDGYFARFPVDALFADGFESSTTSEWSVVEGGLP